MTANQRHRDGVHICMLFTAKARQKRCGVLGIYAGCDALATVGVSARDDRTHSYVYDKKPSLKQTDPDSTSYPAICLLHHASLSVVTWYKRV